MNPGLIKDFRVWAKTDAANLSLLIVDPGGTTGLCLVNDRQIYDFHSVSLEKLPSNLELHLPYLDAVICEDFSIQPGRHGDAKAPSAIGIGMCWSACDRWGLPMFLFQPNMKAAGRRSLDQAGLDARAAARNDHQRDVIDLAGKAMSELRKANQ